jgi:hypothetical protein
MNENDGWNPVDRRQTRWRDRIRYQRGELQCEVNVPARLEDWQLVETMRLFASQIAPSSMSFGVPRACITMNAGTPRAPGTILIVDTEDKLLTSVDVRKCLLGVASRIASGVDHFPSPKYQFAASQFFNFQAAAEWLTWQEFRECFSETFVGCQWDSQLAKDVNRDYCQYVDQKTVKPIVFDIRRNARSLMGMHCQDRIRLRPTLTDQQKWETLAHEIAHYRAKNHRRAFCQELANVYEFWAVMIAPPKPKQRSASDIMYFPFFSK